MKPKIIVTVPPYASFIDDIVGHPAVSGLRLNVVMPVQESCEEVLQRLNEKSGDKDLWVDLKCRQLRVEGYASPPFTKVRLSHQIEVDTPTVAYFSSKEPATILSVEGNDLILQEGPRRVVGPGESVNIPHHSLRIKGYLTETDQRYLDAAKSVGIDKFMLSFVEESSDIESVRSQYPKADLIAKIESARGLSYARNIWRGEASLMAARGDLYMELRPHEIAAACETIVKKDSDAIAASRILDSLTYQAEPTCSDIGDLDNLLRMGYHRFMLGDEVCLQQKSVIRALNCFEVVASRYR